MAGLKTLFDYQRFAGNSRLGSMICDAEIRFGSKIGINDLELISAAGEVDILPDDEKK